MAYQYHIKDSDKYIYFTTDDLNMIKFDINEKSESEQENANYKELIKYLYNRFNCCKVSIVKSNKVHVDITLQPEKLNIYVDNGDSTQISIYSSSLFKEISTLSAE